MSLNRRLKRALDLGAPVVAKSRIQEATGVTEDYLLNLGLTKGDLLKLERHGMAIRAYTQNTWDTGEKLPNGAEAKQPMVGNGRRKVWILIGDDTTGDTNE